MQLDRQMLSLVYRFLRAKTPEQRALVDLETHYTKVSVTASSTSIPSLLIRSLAFNLFPIHIGIS